MQLKKVNKVSMLILILCFGIAGFLFFEWYIDNSTPRKLDTTEMTQQQNENSIFSIENACIADGYIEIDGWAFIKGMPLSKVNRSIVLKSCDQSDLAYRLDTSMIEREDVKESYPEEESYKNAGFRARGRVKKCKAGTYEIWLCIKDTKENAEWWNLGQTIEIGEQ